VLATQSRIRYVAIRDAQTPEGDRFDGRYFAPNETKRPAGIEPAPQTWHACMLVVDTTAARKAPSGIRTRVAGVRGRHPRSARRPGRKARTEGIQPSPADLEPAWPPWPRPYEFLGRDSNHAPFGSEPKILPLDDRGASCDGWARTSILRVTTGRPAFERRRIARSCDSASDPLAWSRTTNLPGLSRAPLPSWATRG
jgi:hypothetical protein